MEYKTVLTTAGLAAIAAATQAGAKVSVTHLAMGDGGGAEYEPDSAQSGLKNECWRGAVSSYTQQDNRFSVTARMPAETDAFVIRELALFLEDGICFAVANAPSIPHQPPVGGVGTEFEVVMPFVVENADSVTVTVDPAGTISQEMVGQPGGVASLGPDGKLPKEQLCQHTHSAADITSGTLAVARGGTGASDALGARTNLDVARPVRAEVTFPATGWAVAGGAYQQTVSCADAAETMRYANIGPKYSPDAAARALEQEAYACIAYVDTADGQLIATCWDGESKPEVNLTLIFEGGAA